MNLQETMKTIIGLLLVVGGIIIAVYLVFWYMLYGGIMQAINNWDSNNSLVVWGIIKAVMCEVGLIPGYLSILLGMCLLRS